MVKNNNQLLTRIGILSFSLAVILYLIQNIINSINFDLLIAMLFFGGIILACYGMTKIEIKGDKNYQKFLRGYSKYILGIFLLIIIMAILGFILNFSILYIKIFFIIFIIYSVIDVILTWIFYYKTYRHIKKVNTKLSIIERKKQLIFLIICIILGMGLWLFFNLIKA